MDGDPSGPWNTLLQADHQWPSESPTMGLQEQDECAAQSESKLRSKVDNRIVGVQAEVKAGSNQKSRGSSDRGSGSQQTIE